MKRGTFFADLVSLFKMSQKVFLEFLEIMRGNMDDSGGEG